MPQNPTGKLFKCLFLPVNCLLNRELRVTTQRSKNRRPIKIFCPTILKHPLQGVFFGEKLQVFGGIFTRSIFIFHGQHFAAFGRLLIFFSVGYCGNFVAITLSTPSSSKIEIRSKINTPRWLYTHTLIACVKLCLYAYYFSQIFRTYHYRITLF